MKIFALILVCCVFWLASSCEVEEQSRIGLGTTETDSDAGNTDSDAVQSGLGCDGIDLLFIVDDSQSMTSVKKNLADNFPKFVNVLDAYNADKGGKLEFRVAVTSASVERDFVTMVPGSEIENPYATTGDDGAFFGRSECGLDASWIEGPGSDFADQFTCLTDVSTDQTTSIEMPFAAMEAALGFQSEEGRPNAGFYNKQAAHLLVVVIITNEDDCSIEDGGVFMFTGTGMCNDDGSQGLYSPEKVTGILGATTGVEASTGGEGRYVLVAIAGPGPGKCESPFGEAWEAVRIRKTVDSLGDYGVFGSICESDLWISLESALNTIKTSCDSMPPVI